MITTDDKILYEELAQLKSSLICRGYKSATIDTMFNKAIIYSQKEVLQPTLPIKPHEPNIHAHHGSKTFPGRSKKLKNHLPFIVAYHKEFQSLRIILNKHCHIIENDETLKKIFPEKPFLSFTRHKNIADHLIRTKMKWNLG